MAAKRLAWIVNHRTLMPAEVPIIKSLGYEVFVPKLIPPSFFFRSGAVDFRFDTDLTINSLALQVLNAHPFYERTWSPTLTEIMNENFDVFVTSVSSFSAPLLEALSNFRGMLVARVFGLEGSEHTYSDVFLKPGWTGIKEKAVAAGDRFVFCQAYDNLAGSEDDWLRERAHTVIASVPDWMWAYRGRWNGSEARALFLCPDIVASSYYGDVYRQFKRELSSIPHWIFGEQGAPVDDPAVLSSLTDGDLFSLYQRVRVFIYTSREPRHLHYSPVEAMIVGAPVLFLSGGLLEYLGGGRQTGMCADFDEMRYKAERLIGGDFDLTDDIRRDQQAIVRAFASDLARSQWAELLRRAPGGEGAIRANKR